MDGNISSDVLLWNIDPSGRREIDSSLVASPAAPGPAHDSPASSRRITLINTDRASTSCEDSGIIQIIPMILSERSQPLNGASAMGSHSVSPSLARSATPNSTTNPIANFGPFVKSNLRSHSFTGFLTLFSFVGALLIGVWGVMLAKKQLDLGEWTFCKSYPNDTQVISSTTCQRFIGKSSLDELNRREASQNVDGSGSAFVREIIPSWLPIPPAADPSSCNVVCWNTGLLQEGDELAVVGSNINETFLYPQLITALAYIQSFILVVIYVNGWQNQHLLGPSWNQIPADRKSSGARALFFCFKVFSVWWIAICSLLPLWVMLFSQFQEQGSFQRITMLAFTAILGNMTCSSYLAFVLYIWNRSNVHSSISSFTGVLQAEVDSSISDISETSAAFYQANHQEQGRCQSSIFASNHEDEPSVDWMTHSGPAILTTAGQAQPDYETPPTTPELENANDQPSGITSGITASHPTINIAATTALESLGGGNSSGLLNRSRDQRKHFTGILREAATLRARKVIPETREGGGTEEKAILGTPEGEGNEEKLDPGFNFKIHNSRYFKPGQVFRIFWSEPQGYKYSGSEAAHTTLCAQDTLNENAVHSFIRKFVIIATGSGCSQCLPIMTYKLQGTSKRGVNPEDHAMIYTGNQPPGKLQLEPILKKSPIKVIPRRPTDKLPISSRINYGKIYTVEHNLKVCFIGAVSKHSEKELMQDFESTWAGKSKLRV